MEAKAAIKKVTEGRDLTEREMSGVFSSIMSGHFTSAQIAAFLTALRVKGETVEEITGAARIMRRAVLKIKVPGGNAVDTCGTGGSGKSTFNFSTVSAFVVSGCKIKVAKHGNRSASGKCGSADVLEALGVKLDVSPRVTEKCINEIGVGFMFAPVFHKSLKYAMLPRKEIGIRTIFNLLGPLCNPAFPKYQLVAVYDKELTEVIAGVLRNLGLKRAFVVSGEDGLDEVTITGKTRVSELVGGKISTYTLQPSDFGFKTTSFKSIRGGSTKTNSGIMKDVLSGKKGPVRDMTVMNSAVAIVAAGRADILVEAVKMAELSIDSGRALEKLELLKKATCSAGSGKRKGKK